MDALISVSEVGDFSTAKKILGTLLNRVSMEIFLERINKNSP
jgi:hypothetical protein